MKTFLISLLILFHLREPPAKPESPENALPGWTTFRFGMSPQRVLAIPGYDFAQFIPLTPSGEDLGAITSKKNAVIYGQPYRLTLFFTRHQEPDHPELVPPQSLGEITLQNEAPASQNACENSFLILLARLETVYGALGPLYPQQKKNSNDRLPMSVQWKTSRTSSRYQLITVFLPSETAYVWEARRNFGTRYVDLSAIWSAQHASDPSACLTILDFKRP